MENMKFETTKTTNEKCSDCGKEINTDDDDNKCYIGCPAYDKGWLETHCEYEQPCDEYIGKVYGPSYLDDYGKNLCKKIVRFTECYVYFQYPEVDIKEFLVDSGLGYKVTDYGYKCKISTENELMLKHEIHRESKLFFLAREKKPLTMEEIKALSYFDADDPSFVPVWWL
jgi:hypothetical protein